MIVTGKAEYDSIKSALADLGGDVRGLQRRPKRLIAKACRKKALEKVNSCPPAALPTGCRIEHSDFRQLSIREGSVNVILTDVVWSQVAERDWADLAALAKRWLKDDGMFCSIIGTHSLPALCRALDSQLHCQWTMGIYFREGYRSWSSGVIERWRPVVIYSKKPKASRIEGLMDTVIETGSSEKEYHDWQQPIEVCLTLAERLTRPGDLVVDPHLGTGTNAVACSLLGNRRFVGCDIDERQVKTARYRVAHEGRRNSA